MKKSWFIESNGVRTQFIKWADAKAAWQTTKHGHLCRNDGTCLDCK